MGNKEGFKNLIALPRVYGFLLNNVWKQKKYIRRTLEAELIPFRKDNDGSLTPADFKKITNYYALGVPGILGEAFCVLRGKEMRERERTCLTFLGGMSGLLDDLFDNPDKKEAHLEKFILQPEKLFPENKYEELLLHFFKKGLQYSVQPAALKQQAMNVFNAQQESIKQNLSRPTSEEIKRLTDQKGGTSFIFYRLCLDQPLLSSEEKLYYHLGGLMQLGNDIFDVWEDLQAGTKTVATETSDISQLRRSFKQEMERTFSYVADTSFHRVNKIKFLQIISLALARVYVCLDQFEKLQQSTGNKFCPARYNRKQLICDMQKPKNHWKAINYYLSFEFRRFLT